MIQQEVPVLLQLRPDGTSSSFSFDMEEIFGIHVPSAYSGSALDQRPFVLLNKSALPDSVSVASAVQGTTPIDGVTASITHKTITVTFPAAPTGSTAIVVTLVLNFNG